MRAATLLICSLMVSGCQTTPQKTPKKLPRRNPLTSIKKNKETIIKEVIKEVLVTSDADVILQDYDNHKSDIDAIWESGTLRDAHALWVSKGKPELQQLPAVVIPKQIIIKWDADWCTYCKKWDIEQKPKMIGVLIQTKDYDKSKTEASRKGVTGLPAFEFPSGEVVMGFQTAESLMKKLQRSNTGQQIIEGLFKATKTQPPMKGIKIDLSDKTENVVPILKKLAEGQYSPAEGVTVSSNTVSYTHLTLPTNREV